MLEEKFHHPGDDAWSAYQRQTAEPDWRRKQKIQLLSWLAIQIVGFAMYGIGFLTILGTFCYFGIVPPMVAIALDKKGVFLDNSIHHTASLEKIECASSCFNTFFIGSWFTAALVAGAIVYVKLF